MNKDPKNTNNQELDETTLDVLESIKNLEID